MDPPAYFGNLLTSQEKSDIKYVSLYSCSLIHKFRIYVVLLILHRSITGCSLEYNSGSVLHQSSSKKGELVLYSDRITLNIYSCLIRTEILCSKFLMLNTGVSKSHSCAVISSARNQVCRKEIVCLESSLQISPQKCYLL